MNRINEIIDFINSSHWKKYEIDYIVLTGGFSKNKMLKKSIRKNITNVPIYFLSNPENSIAEGALMYNLNPGKLIGKNNGKITKKNHKSLEINEKESNILAYTISGLLIALITLCCCSKAKSTKKIKK